MSKAAAVIKWLVGIATGVFLTMVVGSYGFYRCIYWPIMETGFSRGLMVGSTMNQCGVIPSRALGNYLSHFVEGDIATTNCSLLQQEAARHGTEASSH